MRNTPYPTICGLCLPTSIPPQECAPLLYVDEQVTLIILYHSFTYVEFFVCSSKLGGEPVSINLQTAKLVYDGKKTGFSAREPVQDCKQKLNPSPRWTSSQTLPSRSIL